MNYLKVGIKLNPSEIKLFIVSPIYHLFRPSHLVHATLSTYLPHLPTREIPLHPSRHGSDFTFPLEYYWMPRAKLVTSSLCFHSHCFVV